MGDIRRRLLVYIDILRLNDPWNPGQTMTSEDRTASLFTINIILNDSGNMDKLPHLEPALIERNRFIYTFFGQC